MPVPCSRGLIDVLEFDFAGIDEGNADLSVHLAMNHVRDKKAAGRRLTFEPNSDVDAIS
jgi:hypothetical protein